MKLLLDNCVINKLVEDDCVFSLFKKISAVEGTEIFICCSVLDEINNIPDDKKEKRFKALLDLFALKPKVLGDMPAVWGVTRFNLSCFSDGDVYSKILSINKDGVRDAIHAETAVNHGLALVTEDKKLIKAMKKFGYNVVDLTDLRNCDKYK